MKKSKKLRSDEAYARLFNQPIDVIAEKLPVYKKMYGDLNSWMEFRLMLHIFHTTIIPQYLSNTNIEWRNSLIDKVRKFMGQGFVNELQKIDNKRTWK